MTYEIFRIGTGLLLLIFSFGYIFIHSVSIFIREEKCSNVKKERKKDKFKNNCLLLMFLLFLLFFKHFILIVERSFFFNGKKLYIKERSIYITGHRSSSLSSFGFDLGFSYKMSLSYYFTFSW